MHPSRTRESLFSITRRAINSLNNGVIEIDNVPPQAALKVYLLINQARYCLFDPHEVEASIEWQEKMAQHFSSTNEDWMLRTAIEGIGKFEMLRGLQKFNSLIFDEPRIDYDLPGVNGTEELYLLNFSGVMPGIEDSNEMMAANIYSIMDYYEYKDVCGKIMVNGGEYVFVHKEPFEHIAALERSDLGIDRN